MRPTLAIIGHRGFPGVQGGVEKHCEALMPLLAQNYNLRVYRRIPYLSAESSKSFDGIQYIDLPSTRIKGFEAILHTFLCCLHILFHRVDIVNIHNIGPGLFSPLLRLFGIKIVLTYHSPNYEHAKWSKLAKLILKFSEYVALSSANHIIFVNKFQQDKYSPKIQAKSTYIPNGIPSNSRIEKTTFIQKHNIVPGNYILAVGRLTPEKGFDILIKAVNNIDTPVSLVIAGASDHDTNYLNFLKSLDTKNRVIFTGYTTSDNLAQLYSHARLFVLSSINEGFPLVLLEAMSFGLPMIVTDIPATHLVSLPTYCYVKPGDVATIQSKILLHLTESASLHNYNLSDFHWPQIAKNTFIIYRDLIKQH